MQRLHVERLAARVSHRPVLGRALEAHAEGPRRSRSPRAWGVLGLVLPAEAGRVVPPVEQLTSAPAAAPPAADSDSRRLTSRLIGQPPQ